MAKNRMYFLISVAMTLSLVFACISCATTPTPAPPEEGKKETVTITIGALLDLSGPTATSTLPGVDGLRDVNNYFNKKGGLDWDGGKVIVKIEEFDNRYDPSVSLPAYERMAARGLPVVLTHQSTDNLGLKDRAERDKVVIFTLSPTSGALVPPGWVFANYLSYADSFTGFLKWVKDTWDWEGKGTPQVASLTWDTAYGKAHLCAEPYAEELGIEYVGTEYSAILPTDVTPQVERLKELGADYVVTQAVTPIAIYMKDMHRLGFEGHLVIGLNTGLIEWIPAAGADAAVGTISLKGLIDMGSITADHPYMKKCKEIQDYLGIDRDISTFYPNGTSGMVIIQDAIVRALNKVGDPDKVTGQAIYDALIETKNLDTWGATTPISYSATQRRGSVSLRMTEAKPGGSIGLVHDWMEVPDALELYPTCAE